MLGAGPPTHPIAAHALNMVSTRAGMSAPGDLGWQILKTMLRRYEALDGAVVLPLSKRVAHLLSMVFYAKAANPQELVAIEMGNQA